jgi:hypothetical protein
MNCTFLWRAVRFGHARYLLGSPFGRCQTAPISTRMLRRNKGRSPLVASRASRPHRCNAHSHSSKSVSVMGPKGCTRVRGYWLAAMLRSHMDGRRFAHLSNASRDMRRGVAASN